MSAGDQAAGAGEARQVHARRSATRTKWRDYSALEIVRDDLVGNVSARHAFEYDRDLAKLGKPVDRDEWFMTPQTVNAYYNPGMNEIVFPAAILQPPFFDAEADDAVNYGGIGAVIGHEIGHGFDDQGAKYDGDGNLLDWWTETTAPSSSRAPRRLIEQYDGFAPPRLPRPQRQRRAHPRREHRRPRRPVHRAARPTSCRSSGKRGARSIDGLTGDQRFFLGWAQVWRTKSRDAEAIRRLAIDPHSPPEFRCNGVIRNIDVFYDAFEVTPDDELFLDPQRRVRIWN